MYSAHVAHKSNGKAVMRLLIVEDDSSVARFLEKGLQEERYAVDVATDGESGLMLAKNTT